MNACIGADQRAAAWGPPRYWSKLTIGVIVIALLVLPRTGVAQGDGLLGPKGEAGEVFERPLTFGSGGAVHALDAYLFLPGRDLNGERPGGAAKLSRDPLPDGLSVAVNPTWLAAGESLQIEYTIANSGQAPFAGLRFFSFFDGELDQEANTFFDEFAGVEGTPGSGPADIAPDSWMVAEPGYVSPGTLHQGLNNGALANTNALPMGEENDVAMALGFELGDLAPQGETSVTIWISSAGQRMGPLALVQQGANAGTQTLLTYSGAATPGVVSEAYGDVTPWVVYDFRWRLNYSTGLLMGTLVLTNPAGSGQTLSKELRISYMPTADKRIWRPDGKTETGADELRLTNAFLTALSRVGNQDAVLDPGESVAIGEFEFYSMRRDPPVKTLFRIGSITRQGGGD